MGNHEKKLNLLELQIGHTHMKLTFNLAGALYSEKLRKITKKYGKLLSVAKFDERKKMRRKYFSINTV